MKEFFLGLPSWAKLVLVAVIVITVIIIIRKIIVYYKLKKEYGLTENNVVTSGGVTTNIGAIAATIYESFYGSWWKEDEETAIKAVLSCPRAQIPALKKTYFDRYGKNLTEDFLNYLDAPVYVQIKYHIE